jgi:hypothetical protein
VDLNHQPRPYQGFWPIVSDENCFRSIVRDPQFATTVLEAVTWRAWPCLTLTLAVKTIGRSGGGLETPRHGDESLA